MKLLDYFSLPFSSGNPWHDLQSARRSMFATFLFLMLSLLPPAMLLYAGTHHPEPFHMRGGQAHWEMMAWIFLGVELLTVPLMAWLIRMLAAERKIAVQYRDAFLLAAVTAVPLWVSSLGLAIPVLAPMAGVLVLGLLLAGATLYRGTSSILRMSEPIEAQALASQVFSAGALLWVLVCAFMVLQSTSL